MALQIKRILLIMAICFFMNLTMGCNQLVDLTQDATREKSAIPGKIDPDYQLPGQLTNAKLATATISVPPMATSDHIATNVLATAVVKATVTRTSTPTPESTPTMELETHGGALFINSFDEGLLRVNLETGEVESLVPKEEDWLVWGFAVSPDRETMAYWIHTQQKSELWLSNLIEWSPKLILSFSDLEHDTFILWWISNDYLLLEPSITDQRYNDFLPVRAYIINVHQKQVEIEDTGFAFGCLLAPSTETGELATWCPAKGNWTDIQSYYTAPASYYVIIEEAGFLWTTTKAPTEVLVQLRTPDDRWEWSHDRNLVAFPLYDAENSRDKLYFFERSTGLSFIVDQQEVRHYSALDWSPDDQYIAYFGTCATYACNLVTDVVSKETAWTSQMIPGLQNGTYLAWSYDSQYVALEFEGITIVNVHTNDIVQRLDIPSASVLAWLP